MFCLEGFFVTEMFMNVTFSCIKPTRIYEIQSAVLPAWQMQAFYPVGQDKVQAAKRLIDSCKKCICAVEEFGPLNEANRELAEYARRIGKTGKNI